MFSEFKNRFLNFAYFPHKFLFFAFLSGWSLSIPHNTALFGLFGGIPLNSPSNRALTKSSLNESPPKLTYIYKSSPSSNKQYFAFTF